jgi:hypothetical protein
MRLKLREDPWEWRKFTGAALVALWMVAGLMWYRGRLPLRSVQAAGILSLVIAAAAIFRPRWLRGFYRLAMTLGFYLGQGVGRLLLAFVFILVVVPLGLILRWSGKDLLRLQRGPEGSSYWHAARARSRFDRQF